MAAPQQSNMPGPGAAGAHKSLRERVSGLDPERGSSAEFHASQVSAAGSPSSHDERGPAKMGMILSKTLPELHTPTVKKSVVSGTTRILATLGILAVVATLAGVIAAVGKGHQTTQLDIETAQGWIRGQKIGNTRMWLGVPYAKAKRFEAPRSPPSWDGIMRMVDHGDICPQGPTYGFRGNDATQSEDCLNLNVYAPTKVPQHLVNGKLQDNPMPVVVMLDAAGGAGGASTISAQAVAAGLNLPPQRPAAGLVVANGAAVDGSKLAQQLSCIIVTVNYRVGPLGFFASADMEQEDGWSGNYGLLDQVAALRWVRQNIGGFGGDASSITLLGTGAAASLSLLHVSLSSSAGLFKRVVALGNTVSSAETIQSKSQVNRAGKDFQTAVGCTTSDPNAMRSCMRDASAATLVQVGYGANWTQAWGPSMDGVYLRTSDAQAVFRSPVVLQASASSLMLGAPSAQVGLALDFALNQPTDDVDGNTDKLLSKNDVQAILQARFAAYPNVTDKIMAHYTALPSAILPALTPAASRTNVQWLAKVLSDGTVTCRHAAIAQVAYQTDASAPPRGQNGASTPAYLASINFRINNAPGSYGAYGVAGTSRTLLVQDGCWETCGWSQEEEDAAEATASGLLQGALGAIIAEAGDDGANITAKETFTTGDVQTLPWAAWTPAGRARLDIELPRSAIVAVGSAADAAQCAFWSTSGFQ